MSKITREAYIEKRVAEGFTVEQANNEYDGYLDPSIKEATEQKIPTKADMLVMISEAMQNNPNKKKLYNPDFKLSKEYLALKAELEKVKAFDPKKAQEISSQMLSIQMGGTVTAEVRQAEIDKTLEMPIAAILAERKKYEAIITDCEEKLDSFDVSAAQAKADVLEEQYKAKIAKAKNWGAQVQLQEDYEKEVKDLELELITIPMNDLKIKRFEAKEYLLIYEARVKYYVDANRELIRAEMENAKREEIRGSLVDLAEELEGEDAKKAAMGLEG